MQSNIVYEIYVRVFYVTLGITMSTLSAIAYWQHFGMVATIRIMNSADPNYDEHYATLSAIIDQAAHCISWGIPTALLAGIATCALLYKFRNVGKVETVLIHLFVEGVTFAIVISQFA